MKPSLRPTLLATLLLLSLPACVTVYNGSSEKAQAPKDYWLTLRDLRAAVTDQVSSQSHLAKGFGVSGYSGVGLSLYGAQETQFVCPYGLSTAPVATSSAAREEVEMQCADGKVLTLNWQDSIRAYKFASALHTLATYPYQPENEEQFNAVAERFRQNREVQEARDEVRPYKIAAEVAVREKRFDDAVLEYRRGLKILPAWPQGRFNLALIYAELGLYEAALIEMNRYLVLVPTAPNVRKAKDMAYEWQAKLR